MASVVLLSFLATACQQPADRATDPASVDSRQNDLASAPAPGASSSLASAGAVALTNAIIVLPAVAGRPGAAYFTITNRTEQAVTLTGVAIAGARQAQMHQTSGGAMAALAAVEIPAGGTIAFAPGGRHVMVFGLPASLHAGGTTTLTASFKGGQTLATTVTARAPGAAGDAMPGMKMD